MYMGGGLQTMKYFIININKLEIGIVLVNESISRMKTFQKDEFVKSYQNTLNISKKFIILAFKINDKTKYIYGNVRIISELKKNQNLAIT